MDDLCKLLKEAMESEKEAQEYYRELRRTIMDQVKDEKLKELSLTLVESIERDESEHDDIFKGLHIVHCELEE